MKQSFRIGTHHSIRRAPRRTRGNLLFTGIIIILAAASTLDAQPSRARRKAPCTKPYAAILHPTDTIYWYDAAPFTIPVMMGPHDETLEISGGARLIEIDHRQMLYSATIQLPQLGTIQLTAKTHNCEMVAVDDKVLIVDKPMLRSKRLGSNQSGIDAWKGLTARVGELYDPSSEWENIMIPAAHYQTIVSIKGVQVFNRPGVSFSDRLPEELMIKAGTKPEDIITYVYWKPWGTVYKERWVLLISNQPDRNVAIPLERKKMEVIAP